MRSDRRPFAVATLAALLAFTPCRALAQLGWEGPTIPISAITVTAGAIAEPRIAVDRAGNALAVWIERAAPGVGVVKGARYSAASGVWTPPAMVSGISLKGASTVRIAIDDAGNGVAAWDEGSISVTRLVQTARFDASTGAWGPPQVRSASLTPGPPAVAITPSGDAFVVWAERTGPPGVFASRFTAVSGTWSATEQVTADWSNTPSVAADTAGNAVVVWQGAVGQPVRAARFVAATASWSAPADLSAALLDGLAAPSVAMNAAGDAVAVWNRAGLVEAARAPAGLAFGAASTVSPVDGVNETPRVALDPAGNAIVAWTRTVGLDRLTQVSRYDVGGNIWSAPTDVGEPGFAYPPAAIAIDSSGNALVLWSRSVASPGIRVLAARYTAATDTWTTTTNLSAIQRSAYNVDVGFDAAGSAVAVWFETEQGFGVIQSRSWRATLAAPGVTEAIPTSGQLAVTVAVPPAVESGFAATTLEYSLDGGTTWTPRAPAGVTSPLVIVGLTDGVSYDLRVRAVNAAGTGEPSPTRRVRSGTGTVPTNFRVVSRTGNTVTFAWVAPAAGLVPTDYVLEGGIGSLPPVLASLPTGGAATQFTLAIPNGSFQIRIVAVQGGLRLGESPALPISVNAGGFPTATTNLLGSARGASLALSWVNPSSGSTFTGIRLEINGSFVGAIDLPPTESFTFDGVPPGTYTFTVAPLVGAVPGDSSNVVTLAFPGTCAAPPSLPRAFSVSTQGGRVYVDWLPPASGPAVTSYLLSVSGAATGSFPTTSLSLAVPVGPGSYTIAAAALGPCGTGAATPAQTAVVP